MKLLLYGILTLACIFAGTIILLYPMTIWCDQGNWIWYVTTPVAGALFILGYLPYKKKDAPKE